MGGLADLAVFESGLATLTPDPGHGDLTSRTGLEPADLFVADVPEGSAEWDILYRKYYSDELRKLGITVGQSRG